MRSTLLVLAIFALSTLSAADDGNFVRGDVTGNGVIDIADPINLLSYLFVPSTPVPGCLDALDVDDSGSVTIGDAINVLDFLFALGTPPPSPWPNCGTDRSPDSVTCATSQDNCASGTSWDPEPPLATAKGAAVAALMPDGLVHLFGGATTWGGSGTDNLHQVYDPLTELWSTSTPVPDSNTWGPTGQLFGDSYYLIGGWPGGGTLNRSYNAALDSWTDRAPSTFSFTYGHASGLIGDKIYVAGGTAGTAHAVYDVGDDEWTTLAPLPQSSSGMAGLAYEDMFYVWGVGTATLIYDPALDAWSDGPELDNPVYGPTVIERDGLIYIIGGSSLSPGSPPLQASVQIFDPENGTVTQGDISPTCRYWAPAVLLDNQIHVFGGFDSTNTAVDTHASLAD